MIGEIKAAAPGVTLWDKGERASVKGLHVRVSPAGHRAFYLYYRTRQGRQRRFKLGDFGEIMLPEARRRAKGILDRVAIGEDPKGEWNSTKAEETVSDLFNTALQRHWSEERYEISGWKREVEKKWKHDLEKTFGGMRISEVTPAAVREWHGKLADTPYTANRALSILRKLFQIAEELELRPQHSNPCHLVKKHPERKRKRYATPAELKAIHDVLEAESKTSPAAVAFLYLAMYSGSRLRAIERATWDQLTEFKKEGETYGVLVFHGKTSSDSGEDEKVILPPQAMAVIRKLPRVEGMTITGLAGTPRKLWEKVKEKTGCSDLWARDFRRTFATIGLSSGVGMDKIGENLNHKTTQTTKIYAKLRDDVRVETAGFIANQIDQIVRGK